MFTKFHPIDGRRSKDGPHEPANAKVASIRTRQYYCPQCNARKPFLHDHDFFVVAWLRLLRRQLQPSSRRHGRSRPSL